MVRLHVPHRALLILRQYWSGSRTEGFNEGLAMGVNSWNSKHPSKPVSEFGGMYNGHLSMLS